MPARGETPYARLTADEATCRRVADVFAAVLDPTDTAVAIYAAGGGAWAVEAHGPRRIDQAALRARVRAMAGRTAARTLRFGTVAAQDWVAASLAGLAPVHAGRFVVHGAHDRARVPPSRIGIEIEAALAFGTGHHGTTRGCLLALDRVLKDRRPGRRREKVLDVGTGTGVLAIAAAKALRAPVLASDIDGQAVRVARANARANHAAGWIVVVQANGVAGRRLRQRGSYDLVLANILLVPLKRLARPLAGLLAPQGRVVLSGLLPAQAAAIVAVYGGQGLRLRRRIDLDGWTTLMLARGRRKEMPGPPRFRRT